ncbi:MAG: hypothetical protein CVU43_07575 [Chloroflexi bacterium HGW-Chloroflexi-5]|jgi:hypothetical protein|nr:MAG: hypothetical protein CVU43_07575 [Chloroflexi bacterium HGW-Chloroflexi-5]
MHFRRFISLAFLMVFITSCTNASNPAVEITPLPSETAVVETKATVNPTETTPVATETASTAETAVATVSPVSWLEMPIIPELSPAMLEVYQRGLAAGRDPHRFSKIGDCQNIPTYFLAMFDGGTYSLGDEYTYLQPTIDYFAGSWGRKSLAVRGGLNIIAVQNTMWTPAVETYAKKEGVCKSDETPLVCELRDHNPSFAIISMEESWDGSLDMYDKYMRQIIEYVLYLDIVPVLATRSELLTQERQINHMVIKIAEEYDLPLWNFGAAAAKLPNAGLMTDGGDGFHLSRIEKQSQALFDNPESMEMGFTWRNLTALQTMHEILETINAQ